MARLLRSASSLRHYMFPQLQESRRGLLETSMQLCNFSTKGSQVVVKTLKNKHAPPFKNAEFELEFDKGICREAELIDFGCKYKFISKSGSFFNMNGQNFNGKDSLKRYLSENGSARKELEKNLRDKLIDVELNHEKGSIIGAMDGETVEVIAASDTTDEEEEAVAAAEA